MPSYDHPSGTFVAAATPEDEHRSHGDFTITRSQTGERVAYVVDWRADNGVTDPSPLSEDDSVNPFEVFDANTKRYISTTHSLAGACAVAANHYAKGK
jgi:hypothetical protein